MGKVPKKRSLADKVRKTKTSAEIKNNPFEVKINRKKFEVLGRKSKHDVGLPGVSRSKANNKRKETLLKEYKLKNKSSKLIDRRFGEYDTNMAPEDKILKRFAMERQRVHDKKDVYNLNEEEELTHYGQSLAEMEKFNDIGNSDDESEEKGLLSAELTASHFGGGGGLLRRKSPGDQQQQQEEEGSHRAKSRQELIEELIQKSKQEKRERQVQKEESQELTEQLDKEWKSIQALMVKKTPRSESADQPEEKPKPEEYDKMVRELVFEMKAQPSERMKTPEEIAREAREKLQKLEADRLRRMMGEEAVDSTQSQTHMSADDLNDGFILDKEDQKTLSYQDGKWNIGEESEEEKEEEEGEGEEEEEEEEESGAEEEDGDEEEEEEDEEGSSEEEEEEEEDGHSDLESEQECEDEERNKEGEDISTKPSLSKEELKAQQEAAKAELPYTFAVPENYGDLLDLLDGHTPDNKRIILARTQKCNHPSLAVGNKLKLQKLFGFLLEYFGEMTNLRPPELTTVDKLIPELYTLCQMFPDEACKSLQNIFGDAARCVEEVLDMRGQADLPKLDMLVYLKVTALLFPTSDFRHPVTTPAMLYISLNLTKVPVRSLQDVTKCLVLCCLAVEYFSFSKRFMPELISFLVGMLQLAVQDKTSLGCTVAPPFRPSGKCSELLVLSDSESSKSWSKKRLQLSATEQLELNTDLDRDHHRLTCLSTTLDLLKRCCLLYKDLLSFSHIFQPVRTLLSKHLSAQTLPEPIQELHGEVLELISGAPVTHSPLVLEKKKPIPLKLLTPKIVEVLDYGKKRGSSREEREKEKLKHKYKKEFKGALREIRKDSRFLAREKLNEVMNRDAERKRKVKELFGSLATQEGEWKALKRRKKK